MITDRDAFLRAIVDQDEDDAPRLVFADWLDEHGESERAEFIRLQCRLAGQTVPDTAERMRAADLLDGHHREWRREFGLAEREGVRPGEFERGFVSQVEVDTLADFRANASVLRASTAHKVRLTQDANELIPSLPLGWRSWPEVAGVRGLAFRSWLFTPTQTRRFVASPSLADLRSLAITFSSFDSASLAILASTPQLAGLTDLDLTSHRVDAFGIRALADSPYLHRLRSLNLSQGPTTGFYRDHEDPIIALAFAPNLMSLRQLDLFPPVLSQEAVTALADSPYLTGIRSLALAAFGGVPVHLGPLFGSPLLMGLHRLDLSGLELLLADTEALFASPAPPGLRSLTLNVQRCGLAGVRALLASPWSAGLSELRVSGVVEPTDPSNEIPLLLARADSLHGLVRLDLGYLHPTNETLPALLNSPTLDRLVSLRWYTNSEQLSLEVRAWATMTGLPALRRLQFWIWPTSGDYPHRLLDAVADGPLAGRLTHVNTNVSLEGTVSGWRNRERWRRLRRLCVPEATPDLRANWGDVLDVRPNTGTVYHSEE